MNEMSKSLLRRRGDPRFAGEWFRGRGLDIGCGPDPLQPSIDFPLIESVHGFDKCLGSGDAQYLPGIEDRGFDFVVSSHCLEHMHDPHAAVENWLRVLRPGGYLIVTVPSWELYEHRVWPSMFNGDHKTAWTVDVEHRMDHACVQYVPEFLAPFVMAGHEWSVAQTLELRQITDHYDYKLPNFVDQTADMPAECAIEFVLRKL